MYGAPRYVHRRTAAASRCAAYCAKPAGDSRSPNGARVTELAVGREGRPGKDGRREILRQASVALGGRPVTLWEVSSRAELDPQLSSDANPAHHATHLDVDTTLRRWQVPILQGSRWVGCRMDGDGPWVIAPVRARPPAPPPSGRERRTKERLTLELAGLCLGLLERTSPRAPATTPSPKDPATLSGVIAHELGNRLATARAALQMTIEGLGRWTEVAAGRRLETVDELGQVVEELDRGMQFLEAVKDRARGALARWERFDAVRVVRSCCTIEGRVLRERAQVELGATPGPVYLLGDPNALYEALVNLIRNAADALVARSKRVSVAVERVGNSLRLAVSDEGVGIAPADLERIFEPGFTTKAFGVGTGMGLVRVQDVVRTMFGGSVAVESRLGAGTVVTLALPIPPQRTGDTPPPAPTASEAV
jgi:signal transduction histidine kinase